MCFLLVFTFSTCKKCVQEILELFFFKHVVLRGVNVVSEIYQKTLFCSQNQPKIVNVFMVFLYFFLHFFPKVLLWMYRQFFLFKSDTTFSKQFSLKNFLLFSILNSKRSRNMCNLRPKVRNGHFYPMKFQISRISELFSN